LKGKRDKILSLCYNISMMRKLLFSFLLLSLASIFASGAENSSSTPLIIGGNFSNNANTSANTRVFNQLARDNEVNSLEEQLKKGRYNEVINRINKLTAANFLDDRFYLLLAIAYDNLKKYDDVIYSASQAISVAPQDHRAYLLRAGAFIQKENFERARYDVDRALILSPDSVIGKNLQAQLQQLDPQLEQIIEKKRETSSGEQGPHWLLIYVVAILLAGLVFIYCRYEDLFHQPKNSFSRKEVEVKEQYDFIRQIGEGGMGQVYEAYDRVLKRKVAIKRVRPELVRNAYIRDQFLSEARMVALLRHPCIVEVYTVIESESSLYLVFEYVDGQTLETRLDIDGRIPFSQAKKIFECVCQGLEYAHAQDIIHCDLKPGNIMILEDSRAKVMDFGVAKKAVDNQTGARTVAGTPAYMAPEQQKGYMRKQSDVYSLALCLYEALVGQVPWTVKGFDIATKKIVPASKLSPAIPSKIDTVLANALKEDPNERTQSIAEFWDQIKDIEPLEELDPSKTHY